MPEQIISADQNMWVIDSSGAGKIKITDGTNTAGVSGTYLKVTTKDENENQRILNSDDAVTTVNYTSSAKDTVSNIVTSSTALGRKVTDTYDNSGATTLVITRVVANV
ncbi:MAG: hypothetical protein ACE5ES_05750 [Candidatus Nanoarchaeia archaeon]